MIRLNTYTPPKVALLFETTNAYARNNLLGIGDYLVTHGPWRLLYVELERNQKLPEWLRNWRGDGVIVRGENPTIAELPKYFLGPVVDLTPSRLVPSAPWVKSDDEAIAALAAEHFMEKGFAHFAFCGDPTYIWSTERERHFDRLIRDAGHSCAIYPGPSKTVGKDVEVEEIAKWLTQLPRPVGLFSCNDQRGQQVLEACRQARLTVPDEVAVLGVDNDEVLCALSPPPMSSIIANSRRVGRDGAEILDGMMREEFVPPSTFSIPPLGIVTRQSTDLIAIGDMKIAMALRFIRDNGCRGIAVDDVLEHCPMSRRSLEIRMQKLTGRTPAQEILRIRLNHIKKLLTSTNLSLAEIAERSGFEPGYLGRVFKANERITPGEYRTRYATGNSVSYKLAS